MKIYRAIALIAVLFVAPATFESAAAAQSDDPTLQEERPRRRPGRRRPDGERTPPAAEKPDAGKDDKKEDDEEEIKSDDTYLAITGGVVHTVSGPALPGATVLCKNGKILEVGRRVTIPEGAEIIDATGKNVYPGLVAVNSNGLVGGADDIDVFNFNMTLGLAAGITTAVSGTSAAKLTYGTLDDSQVRSGLWETLSYDTRSPQSRRRLRQSFERVRQYQRDLEAYEKEKVGNPEAKKPDDKFLRGQMATYLRLMKGEAKAMMRINRAHQLIQACELAEQYGIEIIVYGGMEAWTVADRVGRAGMSVVVIPRTSSLSDESVQRDTGSSIQNAAILREHGVRVAVVPAGGMFGPGTSISLGGLAGRDLLHLPMAAAFTVRGGLSNQEAVRTITLDAARVIGVDDRVGSIEVGKDADFAITDGDLLHYMTHVDYTIVNGRIAYDKTKDTLFSHIRPADDSTAPLPDDYWPRRLGG